MADLIVIAAIRLTLDEKRAELKGLNVSLSKENMQLRHAISAKDQQIGNMDGQNELMRHELKYMEGELDKCKDKRRGLKPWADIGKGAVITLGAGGLAAAYLSLR